MLMSVGLSKAHIYTAQDKMLFCFHNYISKKTDNYLDGYSESVKITSM